MFDTSIWSQARPEGEIPWIGRERVEALNVLDSLPAGDRVLLLRAEPDAPPILPYTTDHAALRRAISDAQTSSGTANVPRALEMAKAALAGSRRGLLVYVGPGMMDEKQARSLDEFRAAIETPTDNSEQPQFLVRLASGNAPVQDSRHHAGFAATRRSAARSLAFAHAIEKLRQRHEGRRGAEAGE